ncbi:MAG TPA: MOSC N-terminal beta barrel domain-containing protein [Gemmatimonadaceae bacterium]
MGYNSSQSVVSSLTIFPLKGALGCPVESLDLDDRGPAGDRRWMLIDDSGRFVSLREVARLCFVSAELTADGLRLRVPRQEPLEVPQPDANGAPRTTARVWSGPCEVIEADPLASGWLSEFLGLSCRVVFQPDDASGPDADRYGPFGDSPRRIALTDGAPMLLTTIASLTDLNARLSAPVPMYRFRPNIVVEGTTPWTEETWKGFEVGAVGFDAVKPCPRCVATTIDYATGTRTTEPLRTLATFRKSGQDVNFGMNVAHRHLGSIRVGDTVRLLE